MRNARKNNRWILAPAGLVLCVGVLLIYTAMSENMVFFYSPSEVVAGKPPANALFRIGGVVERGSVSRDAKSLSVRFSITDTQERVKVLYEGVLPDLFKEGKGVVAQGRLSGNGTFVATEVLAKHDENYMPPEAKAAVDEAHKKRDARKGR